jgi:hypothetical protein
MHRIGTQKRRKALWFGWHGKRYLTGTMNDYEFQAWVSDGLRHAIVIALIRAGYTAWLDSDRLYTDASRTVEGLTAGHGQVLGRPVTLAALTLPQ